MLQHSSPGLHARSMKEGPTLKDRLQPHFTPATSHMTFRYTEELAAWPSEAGAQGHLAEAQALGSLVSAPGSLS